MQTTIEHVNNLTRVNRPLIDEYTPNQDVFFTSKRNTLLARPPFANLLVAGTDSLDAQTKDSLRFAQELGFKTPVVIGAIPFDTTKKAKLRLSTNTAVAEGLQHIQHFSDRAPEAIGGTPLQVQPVPAPEVFKSSVKDALGRFARGEIDKVVLSRTLEVTYPEKPDTRALLKNLAQKNTKGFTFAIDLNDAQTANQQTARPTTEKTLVGASPELLISRKGNRIMAHPLAGSEPRSHDPVLDQARAEQLLVSEKDLREHALVIKAIKTALAPYCSELHIPEKPSLVSTATMWHLGTVIEGQLKDPETSSLTLALAMHPTPAVCGYPTQKARQAITELETYERDLFTGMVGWCDASGDGEWVVTIRCALIDDSKVRLYAGAGIVAGSSPEKETAETGAKFHTMLNAMGVQQE